MAKDIIHYASKLPTNVPLYGKAYMMYELGEVQQTFNMSFTLDGTKDSVTFVVYSYSNKNAIEPYTIIYHDKTNTWWIVSNDKVNRHLNESGYLYIHELQCLGAVELLNARDLTDCGFRANKYTIDDFIKRLFKLSTFEYNLIVTYDELEDTQVVNYLKTFENYTLLSALNEFLKGYNSVGKLLFRTNNFGSNLGIIGCTLNIKPKTGDTSLDVLDIDDFTDVREIKTLDKNSYGTTVISNAENVVSTTHTIFPNVGTVGLSSLTRQIIDGNGDIDDSNGVIRLPSKAYKVNVLTLCANPFQIELLKNGEHGASVTFYNDAYDEYSTKEKIRTLINATSFDNIIKNALLGYMDEIYEGIQNTTSFDFYDGFLYDAINDEFKLPENAPSGMKLIEVINDAVPPSITRKIVLTDKDTRETFNRPYQGMYWERGSDLIRGLSYWGRDGIANLFSKNISFTYARGGRIAFEIGLNDDTYTFRGATGGVEFDPTTLAFRVDYIPMSDLKIKTSNDNITRDIQLYNQNGKLTDSVAISTLINSYANEITSQNVVRYCDYYDFNDVPKVGQLVNNNGVLYVINNISIDFYQNEQINQNIQYKLECEISMSRRVAVKSLMVNANSNIRDYGIPQKNNVVRKQVYKDIFYIDLEESGDSNYIATLNNSLIFNKEGNYGRNDYTAFIKCNGSFPTYTVGTSTPTGSISNTYYQLRTTRFELKKQVIYEVNFKDNNIIGYDSQNIASGFSLTSLNIFQEINTPISYVESDGSLKGITIQFVNTQNTGSIYQEYAEDNGYTSYTQLARRVFLDESGDLYGLAVSNSSFQINEVNYDKDALEVPVFEYSCQLQNSDNVIVGGDIFNTYGEEWVFIYHYETSYGIDVEINENNAMTYDNGSLSLDGNGNPVTTYAAKIDYIDDISFDIGLYYTGGISGYVIKTDINTDYDLIIYRYAYNMKTGETRKSLMFIIKNLKNALIDSGQNLILNINHKKVD